MFQLNNWQLMADEHRKQIEREIEHARLLRLAEQSRVRQPVLAPVARWAGVRLVQAGDRLQHYASCPALAAAPCEAPAVVRK
jgi:hypothetical protein